MSWETVATTPSGSNTQIQFNNNGSFGADANFTWASSTQLLTITGTSTISGNLGVGTTTPAYKLDVAGQIRFSSGGFVFPDGTTQTTATTATTTSPSFSVHKNGTNQTVTFDTATKVTWSTEKWDTNSNFASNAFTPTVAGKYLFIIAVRWANTSDQGVEDLNLYKNGVLEAGTRFSASGTGAQTGIITILADANGSTDYFEAYVHNNTSTGDRDILGAADGTFFQGYKLP